MRHCISRILAAGLFAGLTVRAADWTEFRGPTGQGHSTASHLPVEWDQQKNVAWKTAVPGTAWSSPVLCREQLFLTTAVPERDGAETSLRALSLDATTGRALWEKELFRHVNDTSRIHRKNSQASPTPITDGEHLYVHFGHQGTACLDLNGKLLWKKQIDYSPVHGNGGSPILVQEKLIFSADGASNPFVVALSARTGEILWKTPRTTDAGKTFSFSTPLLIDVDGVSQVISAGSNMVAAYDPDTGRELWRVRYDGYSVIPRPVYGHGLIFIGTGYDRPTVMAIRPGGTGDLTDTHVEWVVRRSAPNTPSLLLVGQELYMISDNGIASCLDAQTGRVHWQERLGGNCSASPVFAGGRIYVQNEEGVGYVLKPGTDFELLAQNDLGERTLASYAVTQGALFIRTAQHLYRISDRELTASTGAPPARAAPSQDLFLETFDAAWQIIHDSYYDPNFNGVDWTAVRQELRPRAAQADSTRELRNIIQGMLDKLGQSHMSILPQGLATALHPESGQSEATEKQDAGSDSDLDPDPDSDSKSESASKNESKDRSLPLQDSDANEDGVTGIQARLVDEEMVVTGVRSGSPAANAGVKPGWVIEQINRQHLSRFLQEARQDLDSKELSFLAWQMTTDRLSGTPRSTVHVTFRNSGGDLVALDLKREEERGEAVKFGYLPKLYAWLDADELRTTAGKRIGYIHFNVWMIPIAVDIEKAVHRFRTSDGIIVDMRGNIGGIAGMVMGTAGHFLDKPLSLGTMTMRNAELRFLANPRTVTTEGERVEPFSGPVVILTDSISLSAAEIFAGGMQDIGRATVIGETTGGQALPALFDRLPNGDVLYHALADFVTPSGVRIEGRGVIPDIPVTATREDWLTGEDKALIRALDHFDSL